MKDYFLVDIGRDFLTKHRFLSTTLTDKIAENLWAWKKTLLYLNKRGTYPLMVCEDCHHIEKCPHCDVSLSVHAREQKLVCHSCGYQIDIPLSCSACHGTHLKGIGIGTQLVEDSIRKLFPTANIFRMDSDYLGKTTLKRTALGRMHEADIIIGTKMMTTGFDFPDIGLIGIILLEQELHIPIYDIEERVYTTLTQLIGRGGRKGEQTDIVIQTAAPGNEMVKNILESNYRDFFTKTLQERKLFKYPPFFEYVVIQYRHSSKEQLQKYLQDIFERISKHIWDSIECRLAQDAWKREKQYYGKIILKGKNIRQALLPFRDEIVRTPFLSVIFA